MYKRSQEEVLCLLGVSYSRRPRPFNIRNAHTTSKNHTLIKKKTILEDIFKTYKGCVTLYACSIPCLIQLFVEKFLSEVRNSIEIFRFQQIIERLVSSIDVFI